MGIGNSLIEWVLGSIVLGVLWFGVRPIVEDSAGEGIWFFLTGLFVFLDLLALVVIIKEST